MLCELQATRRIMSEAQRLNMVGGHFIWLWADTTSSTEFFDAHHAADADVHNFGPTMLVNDTVPLASKMNNRDVKSETISTHSTRATFSPTHSVANRTRVVTVTKAAYPIDADAARREELNRRNATAPTGRTHITDDSEEENPNFSEGFDPFRLKQRQYDKTRRQERFEQRIPVKEKPLPATGLILGLHGNAGEQQNLGADSQTKKNRRNINGDDDDGDDDDGGRENIFVSNSSRNSSSDGKNRNFSEIDDVNSLDYSIDNNNFNENPFKLRKRTSAMANHTSTANASSSFVLYHHFKDFPIGLLAMRPVRMNIDRHFIRATVRVFAATWAKIDAESKRQKYQSTVINAAAARNVGSSSRNLKNDRQQYERKMRRKRNIGTANDLLVTAVTAGQIAHASPTIQVNTSSQPPRFSKHIANNNLIRDNSSDLNANANILLNGKNASGDSNTSSNQNLSGLTKQSLTNKSNNDRHVSSMHEIGVTHTDPIASAAKNASDAIRRNYLFDANGRQRSNKRQNTWWSLEKETPKQQQNNRNANGEQDAGVAWETPRYLGSCYGTPSKQDVRNAKHFARWAR